MPSQYRYVILALGCAANIIGYSDRSNLSLCIVPMQREHGFDDAAVGVALSGFFMGYVCTQIAGGYFALRYGPKVTLTFAVFAWSLSTLLTPLAASGGLGLLLAARVAIGMGEGFCLPCLHALAVGVVYASR